MAVQFDVYAAPLTTGWTASTARTLVELTSGANHPPEWCQVSVWNLASSGFTTIDFCTYSATGTGTTYTPKRHGQAVGASEATCKVNMTVEGTGGAIVWSFSLPNPVQYEFVWPLGRELFHAVSTVQGIRVTTSVVPTTTTPIGASLMYEE